MFKRSIQGAIDTIEGDDPLNVEHVEEVRRLFEECLRSGQPNVVISLENIPLIDSAGLELLLDCWEESQRMGGAMKLAAVNGLCREILAATGLSDRMEIFPHTLAAVGSFAR